MLPPLAPAFSSLLLLAILAAPNGAQTEAASTVPAAPADASATPLLPSLGEPLPGEGLGPLATSLTSMRLADDFEAGVLLRTVWAYGDGDLANEVAGFDFNDVDIWAEMELEGFDFRVSVDASTGMAVLEDAYVRWVRDEAIALTIGNFKPRVLFSSWMDPEGLVFNDRSLLGTFFDDWDLGAQLDGRLAEKLDYFLSITNGANGQSEDSLIVARAEYTVNGEELAIKEGSRGTEEQDFKIAGVYYGDTGSEARGFGAEVLAFWEGFGGHVEVMHFDDGLSTGNVGLSTINVPLSGDSTPFSVTGWYELNEEFQAAVRYQQTDNGQDTRVYGVGLSYFPVEGPIHFVADVLYAQRDNDDTGLGIQVGVTIGRWRPER